MKKMNLDPPNRTIHENNLRSKLYLCVEVINIKLLEKNQKNVFVKLGLAKI